MRRALAALIVTAATLIVAVSTVDPEPPAPVTEECTEADGACLTWDDIRESETHTQETEPDSW